MAIDLDLLAFDVGLVDVDVAWEEPLVDRREIGLVERAPAGHERRLGEAEALLVITQYAGDVQAQQLVMHEAHEVPVMVTKGGYEAQRADAALQDRQPVLAQLIGDHLP